MPVTPVAGLTTDQSGALRRRIFDAETELHDGAAAITTSGVGQVGGADQILDVGDGVAEVDFVALVTSLDFTTGDETYSLIVQGSSTPDFSSDIVSHGEIRLGNGVAGADDDTSPGQRILGVSNERASGDTSRYIRLYILVGGTSPSITFMAYLAKSHAGG